MKMLALMVIIAAIGGTVMAETEELQVPPADALKLPAETSRYNRGALPGRYRDENRRIRSFELKAPAPLYDGGGRQVGIVTKPVRLNIGAGKEMRVQGRARGEFRLGLGDGGGIRLDRPQRAGRSPSGGCRSRSQPPAAGGSEAAAAHQRRRRA
jgi:hypothetical protein